VEKIVLGIPCEGREEKESVLSSPAFPSQHCSSQEEATAGRYLLREEGFPRRRRD